MEAINEFLKNLDPASFGFGVIWCMIMDCIFALEAWMIEKTKTEIQKRKENKHGTDRKTRNNE